MKKIALAALLAITPIAGNAAAQNCAEFANVMTGRAINIFHDTSKTEEQKHAQLSSLFQEAVDIDWIGQFVLGRFWKQASPEEQAEYLKSYRNYVISSYISKFKDEDVMSIDNIKIASITPTTDNQFEAKTLIQSKGDDDTKVDYLLLQTSDKCTIHDIKVEGISLLSSEHSEFGTLAGRSGVKGVIEAMHKQTK